jgi:hypothetical protein
VRVENLALEDITIVHQSQVRIRTLPFQGYNSLRDSDMPRFIFDDDLIKEDTGLSDSVLDDLLKDRFVNPEERKKIKEYVKDYAYRVLGVESEYGVNLENDSTTAKGGFQFLTGEKQEFTTAKNRGFRFKRNAAINDSERYNFLNKDSINVSENDSTIAMNADEQRALFYLNTFEQFGKQGALDTTKGKNALRALADGTREEKDMARKWLFWHTHYKPSEYGSEEVKTRYGDYTMPTLEGTHRDHQLTIHRMNDYLQGEAGDYRRRSIAHRVMGGARNFAQSFSQGVENLSNQGFETLAARPIREAEEEAGIQRARKN